MPLCVDANVVRAVIEVIRPLVEAVELPTCYASLCLRIVLDKHFIPERNSLWGNMAYRAFHLFSDFDGQSGVHQSTTGYEATAIRPFCLRIDKPTPDNTGNTMTSNQEGPYEVDLKAGLCQCRFSAGHPWVIHQTTPEGRNYIYSGTEARQLQDKNVLTQFFPELVWTGDYGCVVDAGSDPAADCKHLVASQLVLLSCLASRDGVALPEATEKFVDRMVEVARRFRLFPELK